MCLPRRERKKIGRGGGGGFDNQLGMGWDRTEYGLGPRDFRWSDFVGDDMFNGTRNRGETIFGREKDITNLFKQSELEIATEHLPTDCQQKSDGNRIPG